MAAPLITENPGREKSLGGPPIIPLPHPPLGSTLELPSPAGSASSQGGLAWARSPETKVSTPLAGRGGGWLAEVDRLCAKGRREKARADQPMGLRSHPGELLGPEQVPGSRKAKGAAGAQPSSGRTFRPWTLATALRLPCSWPVPAVIFPGTPNPLSPQPSNRLAPSLPQVLGTPAIPILQGWEEGPGWQSSPGSGR